MNSSKLVDFVPEEYRDAFPVRRHRHRNSALAGGSDGAEISVDDWEDALETLFSEVSKRAGGATCYAITACETELGTTDLIPVLDGFATKLK